jgi:hypothetical protein
MFFNHLTAWLKPHRKKTLNQKKVYNQVKKQAYINVKIGTWISKNKTPWATYYMLTWEI